MLKKLLISGSALIIGLTSLQAGSIAVTNLDQGNPANSKPVTLPDGTPIPAGTGYVAIGTFNTFTDAQISAVDTDSVAALAADFAQFGGNSQVGAFGFAGLFTHDASASLAGGDGFVGQPIFTVVSDGASAGAGAGIFIYKGADNPDFAADNPVFEARADLVNPEAANILAGSIGGAVDLGTVNGITLNGLTSLQLKGVGNVGPVVPEPSAAMLLMGGVGLFFIRRRK